MSLLIGSAALPLFLILGWLVPTWVGENLARLAEPAMLASFLVGFALVAWMFFSCATNSSLSRQEKNRWYALMVLGGPITAAVYLWQQPPRRETLS